MISLILLLYIKVRGNEVEIQMEIKIATFAYISMFFIDDGYFPTLSNNIYSQWEEIQRKHQSAVDGWSVILSVSGGRLKI